MQSVARNWIQVLVDFTILLASGVARSDLAVAAVDGEGLTVVHWLIGNGNGDRS